LPGQFILHGLAASSECRTDMALEFFQVALQQPSVEFDLDATARAKRAVVGLADLLGQPDVEF